MAQYVIQCKECEYSYETKFPITEFDDRMKAEKEKTCPECGKENTLANIISCPAVIYRGDGWTGLLGTSGSQSRVDAALYEHDRLTDAVKTDRKYRKRDDEFKRTEEKARNMAEKANGVAL